MSSDNHPERKPQNADTQPPSGHSRILVQPLPTYQGVGDALRSAFHLERRVLPDDLSALLSALS